MVTIYKDSASLPLSEKRRRKRYNRIMSKLRIIIEQSIGSLKMRFPILRTEMRMRPRNCVRVMMACITIYNFLIDEGCGYFDEIENLDDFDWDNVDEPGTYDV